MSTQGTPPAPAKLSAAWQKRMTVDRDHVWHPFTQMKEHEQAPPIPVVGGDGCDLILADGQRVLDGVSSWWTSIHGHSHPRIAAAVGAQAAKLDHVLFAGFTHAPAIEMTERLMPRLPEKLCKVFFSDNGSTAVEVALKMTFQAQFLQGNPERIKIGALHGAYHGDTLGAVGVGELGNFLTNVFSPLLLRCERLHVPQDPRRELGKDASLFDLAPARAALKAYFAEHGPHLAAFIAEPLVQGAGGMRMWPPELLDDLRTACDAWGVYLIFDEVMTGFGRTGTFFACTAAAVTPDVLCLSKGLTGGTLPLALTCATEELYDVFLGDPNGSRAFLHGHSYTANPIACAAAAASLALFDETPVLTQAVALSEHLRHAWSAIAERACVQHARTLGGIAACQLVDPATGGRRPNLAADGLALHRAALKRGLLVRPIGDCLYLMPPLITPSSRVDQAVQVLGECLDALDS